MIYVQFADSTEKTVISCFSGPQDPEIWPNQGTIDGSDARWATYYNSLPFAGQQYLPAPQST